MTFNDIFKSNFLENITSVSIFDMVLALVLAFAMGVLIFFIYKKTFSGVMYSSSFGVLIITLPMITALVMLAVTSNIVLSLGMVGALSIVRFRTAIKEPLDIAFLFWAIAVGIVLAAGLIPLAVFGSTLIGIVMVLYSNKKSYDNPYIVLVICNGEIAENNVQNFLADTVKKSVIKSKTVNKGIIELNYEIRLKDNNTKFINELSDFEGVDNAILVSYNGDYMG
ncbi:MAG: DUF4956 domain-containing protein [Eubacteriaceae bacterium]